MILGTLAAPPLAIAALRSHAQRGFAITAAILSGLDVLFLALILLLLLCR